MIINRTICVPAQPSHQPPPASVKTQTSSRSRGSAWSTFQPSPDLLGSIAAVEAHVVEGGVVPAMLVLLHLGLETTDASAGADGALGAVLAPAGPRALQHGVAAAAEADVVYGGVIDVRPRVGLHAQLEGLQNPPGAVLGLGPLSKAAGGAEVVVRVWDLGSIPSVYRRPGARCLDT